MIRLRRLYRPTISFEMLTVLHADSYINIYIDAIAYSTEPKPFSKSWVIVIYILFHETVVM